MEQTFLTTAMVTIGLGAVATGIVGLVFLPRGEQLSALLALVVGASIGLASLFLMMHGADEGDPEAMARIFMTASFLGFAGVVASLAGLVARARMPPAGRTKGRSEATTPVD